MLYLDWSLASLLVSPRSPSQTYTLARVSIDQAAAADLTQALSKVLQGEELRIGLAEHWVLYWKLKGTQSRLFLAHPDAESWVGTIMLSPADASGVAAALARAQSAPASVTMTRLLQSGGVHPLSNFDLVIEIR